MALAKPTFRADYANGRQLSPLESFSRASSASRLSKLGALVQAAANQPRFDFDPTTLACRGLLIEPAATNLLLQSQCDTGWSSAGTSPPTVANSVTFAGEACGSVVFDSASVAGFAGSRAQRTGSTATVVAGTTYAWQGRVGLSRPLAAGEAVRVYVTGQTGFAVFDITSANTGDYVGKFRQIWASSAASVGGSVYPVIHPITAITAPLTVYFNCGQIEVGTVPTSYVATATATATRAAEQLTITGADFARIWRADEWTLVVEGVLPTSLPATGNRHLLYLGDGGGSNRIAVAYNHVTGRVEVAILQGGVVLVNQAVGPVIAAGQSVRVGVSCKTGGVFLVAVNGSAYTGAVVPAALSANTLAIGTYQLTQLHWGGPIARTEMHARYANLDELVEVTR